jgi:hypothetical protein
MRHSAILGAVLCAASCAGAFSSAQAAGPLQMGFSESPALIVQARAGRRAGAAPYYAAPRHRHSGAGAAAAIGLGAAAIGALGAAAAANAAPAYGYGYPGYGAPAYAPGYSAPECQWVRQPFYDGWGSYQERMVEVCD